MQVEADKSWRACGLRRIGSSFFFALAKDVTHPSMMLDASSDYRLPRILESLRVLKGSSCPITKQWFWADDKTIFTSLEDRLKTQPHADQRRLAVDEAGGNLMHMLADTGKLLRSSILDSLQQQLSLLTGLPVSGRLTPEILFSVAVRPWPLPWHALIWP